MRPIQLCLVLLAAVLALAGCRGDGIVAVDPHSAERGVGPPQPAENTVPFHASVRNTIEVVGPPPPPIINAVFPGIAKMNPFGPCEMLATSQIDITVVPFHQVTQYVFTFRNGDELHMTSVGIGDPDAPPGTAIFSGDFTIIGGTGHFKNATGGGTYAGTADTDAGTGQFDMDGVIAGFGGPGH